MKISVFIEDREDVHHITHVMRYKEGNHIIITFSDKRCINAKLSLSTTIISNYD